MATPPYFEPLSQLVLRGFFTALADRGGLPFWLYHQPEHTKVNIEPETVAELAQNPNIVGIKASAWVDILYFHRLLRLMRGHPEFRVLMGEDINGLSGLVLGDHGMVATLANLVPEEFVGLWKAITTQNLEVARNRQDRIMDVQEQLLFRFEAWRPVCKLVLELKGIFSTTICSRPAPVLDGAKHQEVEAAATELCLL